MSRLHRAVPLLLVGLLSCRHSDPFTDGLVLASEPFSAAAPVRLTYNELSDESPALSPDGTQLVYSFERPTPDGDRCLGILPSGGGPRRVSACAWQLDDLAWRDGLDQPALTNDGRILFNRHRGGIGNLTSREGGVYVADIDHIAGARLVLPLLTPPPGASAKWDDFREPVWLGNDAFLGLGAQRHFVTASCPPGCSSDPLRFPPTDTVVVGVEIARLQVTEGMGVVTPIAPAPGATTFAVDRSNDMIYYVAQTPAPGDDAYREPVADTLFRVSMAGGAREAVAGWPRPDRPANEHIDGLAVAQGRIFLAVSSRVAGQLSGTIVELGAGTALTDVARAPQWYWGRLRATPDGRALIAESIGPAAVIIGGLMRRSQTDLYRLSIAP